MESSNNNLAELAFMLSGIFCLVVKYAPNDVTCDVNESKIISMKYTSIYIEFRKDFPDLQPSSPTIVQEYTDYLTYFFKE